VVDPIRCESPGWTFSSVAGKRAAVGYHRFDVVKDDRAIAASQSVALRNVRAAWPRVVELVSSVDQPGCRIRVTNEAGEVVILVGVVSAGC
jgi:hypothetical protein